MKLDGGLVQRPVRGGEPSPGRPSNCSGIEQGTGLELCPLPAAALPKQGWGLLHGGNARGGGSGGVGHPDGEQRSFLILHHRVHALVRSPASPGWSFMAGSLSLWPLITSEGGTVGSGSPAVGGAGKNEFQGDTPPPSHAHIYHQTRCSEGEGPARALPSSSYSWDYPYYCFPNENSFAGLLPHLYLLHEIQATQERKISQPSPAVANTGEAASVCVYRCKDLF